MDDKDKIEISKTEYSTLLTKSNEYDQLVKSNTDLQTRFKNLLQLYGVVADMIINVGVSRPGEQNNGR